MRSISRLAVMLGFAAAACSAAPNASGEGGASPSTGSPPAATAASQASDLRTHLDLLLAEHVMIVAKETAAAVNHSDVYSGYTALLSSNESDLTRIMREAFGSTTADQFAQQWRAQNGYLVDYGIGVVTHNDSKAAGAMTGLNATFVKAFASLTAGASGLSVDMISRLMSQQLRYDKAFIDDAGAQSYSSFYADLEAAYLQASLLGDALAPRIAQKFPDRFPGDPTLAKVDRRVSLNLLFQQHALVATMATDAAIAGRDGDRGAAVAALGVNARAVSRSLSDLLGGSTGGDFDRAWSARMTALLTYAGKGDGDSKAALLATVTPFATAARVPVGPVQDEMVALIAEVNDQRGKLTRLIAGDDRAAATSMQPIADSIAGAAG